LALSPRPALVLAAVFAGGVAGGLARYAITSTWPPAARGFPWATFTVNTAGAFALAVLLILIAEQWSQRPYLRPLLGTGFLGAFTTFSSVVSDTDQLAAHGHLATALVYPAGSLVAGLAAALLGLQTGRALARGRRPGPA